MCIYFLYLIPLGFFYYFFNVIFYFGAPINGILMTILQVQFSLAYSEKKDFFDSCPIIIFQAVIRFLNILFFLINTYEGRPTKLCEKTEKAF